MWPNTVWCNTGSNFRWCYFTGSTQLYYWSPIGLTAKPMSWLKLSCFCIKIASFILLLKTSSSWLRMILFSQLIPWSLSIACAATAESSVLPLFRCRLCLDCRVESVLPISPIYILSQSRHGMLYITPFLDHLCQDWADRGSSREGLKAQMRGNYPS